MNRSTTFRRAFLAVAVAASCGLGSAAAIAEDRRSDSFGLSDLSGSALSSVAAGRDWCIGGFFGYGDFNADGKTDLYCLAFSGNAARGISTGTSLVTSATTREGSCRDGSLYPLDFDGDGKTDLHCEHPAGRQSVGLTPPPPRYSTGPGVVANPWCNGGKIGYGDFDGDGRADFHCRFGADHTFGFSNGAAGYVTSVLVGSGWCAGGEIGYGDFNGDGKTDLHCRVGGGHYFGISSGASGYLMSRQVASSWCASGQIGYGDFNGDGLTDLHCRIGGQQYLGLSNLSPTGVPVFVRSLQIAPGWCATGRIGRGDFNDDGMTDLHCELPGGSQWRGVSKPLSANGVPSYTWSHVASGWCAGGRLGYGDFDGDGRTDLHCEDTWWRDDMDADGVDDSELRVIPCGNGLERSCLDLRSSLPGAARQIEIEPEPVTVHRVGALGRHYGGALSAIYAYYTRASDLHPVLAVFDPNTASRMASVKTPANYTFTGTYFGVMDGPHRLKRPFLAPGAHGLADPALKWEDVCVFDPTTTDPERLCGAGFRKDATGNLTYQASYRHSGGWLSDEDGDGWDDVNLPYLGGYIQTLSGATGAQLALTQYNATPGDPAPFHGGRNYGSFQTFTGTDGRQKLLVMSGNPVGTFPDLNCNVSRFVAVLDDDGLPQERQLSWSAYYSFIKSTFRATLPPDPSCPPGQCCPVAPESLEVVRPGDMMDRCVHRFSDSLAYAGTEPITLYSYFTSDAPANTCFAEQRREWASCFVDTKPYDRCADQNFLPTTGYWTVQARRLLDGARINVWSKAYAWGRVKDFLPGEPDLFLIEPFTTPKVRFDMEGYTPSTLWVAKIQPDYTWKFFGKLPVAGRPRVLLHWPTSGAPGSTWEGIPELVVRDVDGDGLRDVQLDDGTWIGHSAATQAFATKLDPGGAPSR